MEIFQNVQITARQNSHATQRSWQQARPAGKQIYLITISVGPFGWTCHLVGLTPDS